MTHRSPKTPIPWIPQRTRSPADEAAALDLHRIRVLVVDDNAFGRRLMRLTLNSLDIRDIAEAGGTKAALAAMRTFIPDLIFVDWEMDPVDGLTFVREVRGNDALGVRCTPIMLVSGYSERWRIERARDAGANEYVVKPYTVKTIYTKVRGIFESQRPFVDVQAGYFGPDRRRHDAAVAEERRAARGPRRSPVRRGVNAMLTSA